MSRGTGGRMWAWALAAVVLCGALLRMAGVGLESVDLEEYACIGALNAHGFWHFLLEQRNLYPYGAPLVPLLYHFWSGLFGEGVVAMRMLSAVAGTALLVLVYFTAREVWPENRRTARVAGLTAALFAALSPVHIYEAQEARMYAFVALFALLSGVSLLRAVRTGRRRWWAVNLAANAALVWSHYLAVLLWPAQALWLLAVPGLRWRAWFGWLAAHALLLVPVALWIHGITAQPRELHDYYTKPDLTMVAANLVADDAVHWSTSSYFPSGRAWFFAPEPIRRFMIGAYPVADAAVALAFLAALVWGLLRPFRGWRAGGFRVGYLLLWSLVPITLLVVLSFAWKPVYASRYLTHSSVAVYLLLGGLAAALKVRSRGVCIAVLAGVYAWQLSLAFPPQTRSQWKQAGQMIVAADGQRGIALVEGVFWKPVFDANLGRPKPVVAAVLEPQTMAEMSGFLLRAILTAEPGTPPSCWDVLVDAIHGQKERFETAAAPLGLVLQQNDLPGERTLAVYRVTPKTPETRTDGYAAPQALLALAADLAAHAASPDIGAFQDRMRTRPDQEAGGYLRLGVELAASGRTALAAAVLDEALARWPAHLVDLVLLQRALTGHGDFAPLADRAFARIQAAPERTPALRQVLQSLMEHGETAALADTARRMIGAFPDYAEGYGYLGKVEYEEGNFDGALPNLARAVALDPQQLGYVFFYLGDILLRKGRCPEALRVLEQGLKREPMNSVITVRLIDAQNECGDPSQALALADNWLAHDPGQQDIRSVRAQSLLQLGRWDEADRQIRAVLADNPSDIGNNMLLWRVLAHARRDEEAREVLEKVAGFGPEIGAIIRPLADALYVRHDGAEALRIYRSFFSGDTLPADLQEDVDRLCPAGEGPSAAAGTP